MPARPSTDPTDDRLSHMGRALAASLLSDTAPARPQRPSAPLRPGAVARSAEVAPSRQARREARARREQAEAAAAAAAERARERLETPPVRARRVRVEDLPAPTGPPAIVAPPPATSAPPPAASAPPPEIATRPARPPRPATIRPAAPLRDPFASLPWPADDAPADPTGPTAPARRPVPHRPRREVRREPRPETHIRVLEPPPPPEPAGEPDPESAARRRLRGAVEWAVVLGAAAVAALVLQHFVFQLYEIPSESMYPTLKIGDRVAVNKLAYSFGGGVERGDVIVFERPEAERTDDPTVPPQLIKRVIGLPGDVVEARGGVVYIDGKPLAESGAGHYLDPSVVTNNLSEPVTVPPGHVFVMGDNRERSHDSRYFGPIPESDIIGRAVAIAWPSSDWSTLGTDG